MGATTVSITVTDHGGMTASTSFSITVISTPSIGAISETTTFNEDAGAQALHFTVVDADGDSLTITYDSSNTNLFPSNAISFTGTNVNSSTNVISQASSDTWITITVTPTTNTSGSGEITVTIT
ncbi:hypothetical protein MHK_006426, partial [Candidatus Magnetomorum sp. HK-1]